MKDVVAPRSTFRGVMLMELLIVLLLMGAFTVILSALFVVTFRAHVGANRRDALTHRVDAAIAALRRDVWGARRMAFADGHLDLQIGDRETVRWDTATPHQLTRKQTGDRDLTTTWVALPAVDSVEVHGPLVTATFSGGPPPARKESITLVSAVLMEGSK